MIFATFNGAAFIHMFLTAPETKGKTLEEMDEVFNSGLPPWKQVSSGSRLDQLQKDIEAGHLKVDVGHALGHGAPRPVVEEKEAVPVHHEVAGDYHKETRVWVFFLGVVRAMRWPLNLRLLSLIWSGHTIRYWDTIWYDTLSFFHFLSVTINDLGWRSQQRFLRGKFMTLIPICFFFFFWYSTLVMVLWFRTELEEFLASVFS